MTRCLIISFGLLNLLEQSIFTHIKLPASSVAGLSTSNTALDRSLSPACNLPIRALLVYGLSSLVGGMRASFVFGMIIGVKLLQPAIISMLARFLVAILRVEISNTSCVKFQDDLNFLRSREPSPNRLLANRLETPLREGS